jgi:hypothetical protein
VPPPKPDAPKTEGAEGQPAPDTEMKQEEVKVEPPKQEYEIRKKNKKSTSHLKSDI